VVREDPVRRGLLYLGTELGFYVSFDAGERWQKLQLNLPVVPITDLQVRGNDLVASTSGRAFWILDDLSPLRQYREDLTAATARLYRPADAVRTVPSGGFGAAPPRMGRNPPAGAMLYYHLKEAADTARPVKLEILDSAGTVIRSYSSLPQRGPGGQAAQSGPGAPPGGPSLPARAGLNRFAWDLRHERPTAVPGAFVFGALVGRRVVPGTYQARLTVGDFSETQSFRVLADPRVRATAADFKSQDDLLAVVSRELSEIHTGVNRVRAVREQVSQVMARSREQPGASAVDSAGRALLEKLTAMEDSLIQKRTVDGQTVINFPMRLNQFYIYLMNAVDGADDGVTDGARRRFADLQRQWSGLKTTLDRLLGADLAGFNDVVRTQGIPAVVAPPAR
jgi:hypothetical protein